jgi:hypothetical protein
MYAGSIPALALTLVAGTNKGVRVCRDKPVLDRE